MSGLGSHDEVPARSGVLCAGSIVLDVAKVIDAYPARDRLAVITDISTSTGGPAANLAVDLARLEAPFPLAVAGVVGDDTHADVLFDAFADLGINTSALRRTSEAVTSFTDAMVEADGGSRTFFHHPGANALMQASDVDLNATTARILHMGAPGLHAELDQTGSWATILQAAQAAGLHTNLELVSLEPPALREVAGPCLPHLDSLVVNEIEASALVGAQPPSAGFEGSDVDWTALEDIARALLVAGVRKVVVIHFPGGCVAATPTEVARHGSVRLPRDLIRNATGAGDAFASGVVYGLHEDWPLARSLEAGVCVAAACLCGPATSDGVGTLAQCLELGRQHGYRPTA